MAKDKGKTESASLKNLEISAKAIIDNIVFSKTDKMAYYKVSNEVYDFLSSSQKVGLGLRITSALNNLMSERQEPLEGHLIITSVPVDVDSWSGQVKGVAESWGVSKEFDRYLEEQIRYLKNEQFHRKTTYLGVSLGKRGAFSASSSNIFETGFKGAIENVQDYLKNALRLPTDEIKPEEEHLTKMAEAEMHRILSVGNLQARRCTAEEILLLIKRQFYPSMRTPYLDIDHENRIGPGDIALEVHKSISKSWRHLKINQMVDDEEQEGYRACLTFSKFPKFQGYPNAGFPFFYFPSRLGLPFTCYSRFELHPSKKMKLELEKKKNEHKDEIENISAGQTAIDATVDAFPSEVMDSLEDIRIISDILAQDKSPWVHGYYRIVVETPTEELLKKYCTIIKQKYSDLDINVNWSSGNQASLFLEQMPGDRVRFDSFKQITNLTSLSTSGFNFSSDVGDPIYGSEGEV